MKISVTNSQKDLLIDKQQVKNLFTLLLSYKRLHIDAMEVHFVTDRRMKKEHADLFGDPSSTDCMTCPIDDPYAPDSDYCFLGSCLICPRTALNYASSTGKDPYEELSLYCVHCFLHLIGYEDNAPQPRKNMRSQERVLMRHLRNHQALLKRP